MSRSTPTQQADRECTGCFPNGNEADLTGVQFEQGGGLTLLPVDVDIIRGSKVYRPSAEYGAVLNGMVPLLPIGDDGLTVLPSQGKVTIIAAPLPERSRKRLCGLRGRGDRARIIPAVASTPKRFARRRYPLGRSRQSATRRPPLLRRYRLTGHGQSLSVVSGATTA